MFDITLCGHCGHKILLEGLPVSNFHRFHTPSSYVPTQVEASTIFSLAREVKRDISAYEEEIRKTRRVLLQLEEARDSLVAYRNEKLSLLSPVRKLPTELLEQIFSSACGYGLKLHRSRIQTMTIDLSQVCSYWRAIVQSSPRLWSGLWIDLSIYSGHEAMTKMILLYLERSWDAPLQILLTASSRPIYHCSCPPTGDVVDRESLDRDYLAVDLTSAQWQLLRNMFKSCLRWENVHLFLRWDIFSDMPLYVDLDDKVFPLLEELELFWEKDYSEDESDDEEYDELIGLFEAAPKLRRLTLPSSLNPLEFKLPWSQLTSFGRIEEWRLGDIASVLVDCPNVHNFEVVLRDDCDDTVDVLVRIHETGIRSLSLLRGSGSGNGEKMVELLSHLAASNLIRMAIQGNHSDPGPTPEEWDMNLMGFVTRSGCLLQSLTLEGNSVGTAAGLLDLLVLIPSLTHLKLVAPLEHQMEGLIEQLATPLEETLSGVVARGSSLTQVHSILLPSLETLHLTLSGGLAGCALPSPSKILDMAQARALSRVDSGGNTIIERLKSLSVDLRVIMPNVGSRPKYITAVGKARIEELKEGGMDVRIGVSW
ncbi:hypothetical protein D9757_009071 [Collybiopsis confluens]|uniref:F-box domain-containing protein n=1 Tax=Collybiopsis confluens TaxID=2823264 RepID=A0A8H5M5F4_9AGAR|nr:hypothetical protein D9757_009071 [Collybiopsis confluens]